MFDSQLVDPPAALVAGWVLAEAAEDAAALRAGIERLDAGQPGMSTDGLWALLRRIEARDLEHPGLVPVGQDELVDRMHGWAIVTAHTQARALTQIAHLAEHREVGLALKVGRRTAKMLLDDAVTLTEQLPDTMRALEAGRWKVGVIVNLSTLLGLDDDPATLVGHGTITADTARALAADGTWRRAPASGRCPQLTDALTAP